jgi:hypothetical protein
MGENKQDIVNMSEYYSQARGSRYYYFVGLQVGATVALGM